MPLAEPICSTRSTGRKSTPRSRLDVHTTARSVPPFSPSSTHSRTSRASEPWCSAIDAGPVGARVQQRLVPALGLRARVGEDQRRAALLDGLHHLRQHAQAHVAAPREALGALGQQRVDDDGLGDVAAHQRGRGRVAARARARPRSVASASSRLPSVADSAQHISAGPPLAQPRQRQLHLHAALVAQQLVPLVDDHQLHVRQRVQRVGARQLQRQALGRGHQHGRQAPVLRGALGRRRVAAAQADRPRGRERRPAARAAPAWCRRPARASA